ncbi:MAG TPA: tetratricopeptide repeat protein, partial [Planctomycetota bacterium]|nr:tetratricopeptide repeat protein [Planctomycetota bacterium]
MPRRLSLRLLAFALAIAFEWATGEALAGDVVAGARDALHADRPQQALARLLPALEKGEIPSERISLAHLLAARAYARLEDPEGALEHARKVASDGGEDTSDERALLEAWALNALGEPESAASLITRLLSTKDALAEIKDDELLDHARLVLVEAEIARGRSAQALELLRAIVATRPSADALHRLGVIELERGANEDALKLFERVLELRPDDYYAAIYATRALLHLDRAAEAERLLARWDDGSLPETLYLRGRARALRDDHGRAAQDLRRALERDPRYLEASYALSMSLRKLGREDDAREELRRFARLRDEEADTRRRAHALEQEAVRAREDARPALELARLYLDRQEPERAVPWAWRALHRSAGNADARLIVARAESALGRYANAASQYRRILRADPSHTEARRGLEELIRARARSPS